MRESSSGQGTTRWRLGPALLILVLMTLATERGLSSTTRKPSAAFQRATVADVAVPAFINTL